MALPLLEPCPDISDLLASLLRLHSLCELGQDLVEVTDAAEIGEWKDRRFVFFVNGDDVLRTLHADRVLDRPGDTRGEVQLGRYGLARLADLRRVGVPAGVDHRAGGSNRAVATERLGQVLRELEALGLAEATAARHEDVGALDVDVRAPLFGAREHRRL